MKNYQNSKIYKLVSISHPDEIYFGSTIHKLSKRMAQHRYAFKHSTAYYSAKEILKYDDCQIILVENVPCNSIEELNAREFHYISNFPCVNKMKTGNTESYYQEHKVEILNRSKENYENHKEEKLKYAKQYRLDNKQKCLEQSRMLNSQRVNCDICALEMRKDNLKKHKLKIHEIKNV